MKMTFALLLVLTSLNSFAARIDNSDCAMTIRPGTHRVDYQAEELLKIHVVEKGINYTAVKEEADIEVQMTWSFDNDGVTHGGIRAIDLKSNLPIFNETITSRKEIPVNVMASFKNFQKKLKKLKISCSK